VLFLFSQRRELFPGLGTPVRSSEGAELAAEILAAVRENGRGGPGDGAGE
jgi:hypothetical protein